MEENIITKGRFYLFTIISFFIFISFSMISIDRVYSYNNDSYTERYCNSNTVIECKPEYIYDSYGNVKIIICYDIKSGEMISEKIYEYSRDGKLLGSIIYNIRKCNNTWKAISSITLDSDGVIVDFIIYDKNGKVFCKFIPYYDTSGRILGEDIFIENGKMERVVYNYNEDGKRISEDWYNLYNEKEGEKIGEVVYVYDKNGEIVRKVVFDNNKKIIGTLNE